MSRALMLAFITALGLTGPGLAAQPASVWLDVPFVKQEKAGCGAASVAMVMQYWIREGYYFPAEEAQPGKIHATLFSPEAKGTRASDLEHYLREHGFETYAFSGDWNDLAKNLARGRPLIVCLKPSVRGNRRHFLVVAGVDAEHNVVLVNDPARRKLAKLRRQRFEEKWKAANSWTLLALPAEDR
ncbi:MAG TPA: C39 family peptidase [Terriglobia bacterium]|nr:C39 family peptidase [Terriglobia bacterium]